MGTPSFEKSFQKAISAVKKGKGKGLVHGMDRSYHNTEIARAQAEMRAKEKAPLAERKESQREWLEAMRDHPEIVAERIIWMLDGNYGYGARELARQVYEARGRTNRVAQLAQLIASFEWMTPQRMAIDAWKKLTNAQKTKLDLAIQKELADYTPSW